MNQLMIFFSVCSLPVLHGAVSSETHLGGWDGSPTSCAESLTPGKVSNLITWGHKDELVFSYLQVHHDLEYLQRDWHWKEIPLIIRLQCSYLASTYFRQNWSILLKEKDRGKNWSLIRDEDTDFAELSSHLAYHPAFRQMCCNRIPVPFVGVPFFGIVIKLALPTATCTSDWIHMLSIKANLFSLKENKKKIKG